MKLHQDDHPDILTELDKLAQERGYSKIFAKIPSSARKVFLNHGYQQEASIPGFYNGIEDAYFMGKYYSNQRSHNNNVDQDRKVLAAANSISGQKGHIDLNDGFQFHVCRDHDVPGMASVYKEVFETYPFPIHQTEYISKTMEEGIVYFSIQEDSRIIALSSAEIDIEDKNAEMTDFATLPEYRGRGLSSFLLDKMEENMQKWDVETLYTIARASSFGMNIVFAKAGYIYAGTLVNNTNISGNLENMNVWYKHI